MTDTTAIAKAEPKWKGTLTKAMPSIQENLPSHVKPEKFAQVARSAIGSTPMLRQCIESNPQAVLTALSRCAADGLLPDGRLAALVPFRSKERLDLTYIPMIAGVLQRMRNSGKIESVTARIVFEGDAFEIVYGDDEQFIHKPALSDQGDAIGAYAIIKFKDGEVYREWMSRADIMKVKNASRAKGGPWSGPFEHEMWRKTVLKRAAKYCPFSDDIRELLDRDNELYDPSRTIEAQPSQNTLVRKLEAERDRQRQPRYGAQADEEPVRDVYEDVDDEIPTHDEDGVIDADFTETGEEAAPSADTPQEEAEAPPPPQDASASSTLEQAASTKRFYAEALGKLSKTKPEDKAAVLRKMQDEPFWFDLTETQAKTLQDAARGV